MKHNILSLHIPDFQAWSRMREGQVRPVVVARRGRVTEATADLRDAGVCDGTPVERVTRLFPRTSVFEDDPAFTRTAHDLLCHHLNQVSPSLSLHIPHFFCIEPPSLQRAQQIAERLHVRAGLAGNDRLACLAARTAYEGIVEVVAHDREAVFMAGFPVALLDVFGINGDMIERLDMFGYRRLEQLSRLSRRHLAAQFGADGVDLYAFLHSEPRCRLPLWTPPPAVEATFQWEERVREPGEWLAVLDKLCQEGAIDLAPRHTTLVSVILSETPDAKVWRRSLALKTATGDARLLAGRLRSLLLQAHFPPFGRMTVHFGGMVAPDDVQGNLFTHRENLRRAERDILRRYPRGLLDFIELDVLAALPEDRWTLNPLQV